MKVLVLVQLCTQQLLEEEAATGQVISSTHTRASSEGVLHVPMSEPSCCPKLPPARPHVVADMSALRRSTRESTTLPES